MSEAKENAE
jgi:hypothetical protein